MRFADEDDIETWYSEEKEKLDEAFQETLTNKQDHADDILKKYDAELKKLISKYHAEYDKLLSIPFKKKEE